MVISRFDSFLQNMFFYKLLGSDCRSLPAERVAHPLYAAAPEVEDEDDGVLPWFRASSVGRWMDIKQSTHRQGERCRALEDGAGQPHLAGERR